MSTAVVTANKGVFRGLNLRQKTLLIIGLTSLLLLTIVVSSVTLDEDSLKTDFGSKTLTLQLNIRLGQTGWEGTCLYGLSKGLV